MENKITHNMCMNVTLSVEDDIMREARRKAESLGTSVNCLVRVYLRELAGGADTDADAAEFEKLSRAARGNSHGWKFDREALHSAR